MASRPASTSLYWTIISSSAALPAPDTAWHVDTITRLSSACLWIGLMASAMMMVEQLGLAMMPLCFLMASGLTSGTTSGTSGSRRNVLLLSITTAPAFTASGAITLLIGPPAKKAICTSLKASPVASSTT